MKRPFSKPATTYAQQIALLQQRGMIIGNPTEAEFYLQHYSGRNLADILALEKQTDGLLGAIIGGSERECGGIQARFDD